ncbi:MAG: hypothetical protein K8I82_16080 [Anaerolineae bacterium]|nr:hypothetical protein [Anaerolineae bacterium]
MFNTLELSPSLFPYMVSFNDDGSRIVVSSHEVVKLWDTHTGEEIAAISASYDVDLLEWQGDSIASSAFDGLGNSVVTVWDSNTLQIRQSFETVLLFALTLSPDGRQLAYGGTDGTLQIIPVTTIPNCTFSPTTSSELSASITTANGTSEPDTICLTDSATYMFTTAHIPLNALPAITSEITIVGNGATLTRQAGSPLFGFFEVSAGGSLTLENLTLNGGDVGNDTGGALVNEGGMVTLNNVTFTNNHANTEGSD